MTTLYLLRHAKAAREAPAGQDDHARPLNEIGEAAADALGAHLASQRQAPPELVLCSTAERARQTAERVLTCWLGAVPPVRYERRLYLCGPAALLARLHEVPDGCKSVLLVGHNPDVHLLAVGLAGRGPPDLLGSLRHKYPTGAWTELKLGRTHWADLEASSAKLVDFVLPRSLLSAFRPEM